MLLPRKWALSLGLLAAVPSLATAGPFDAKQGPESAAASADRGNQDVADDIGKALGSARLSYKDVQIEYQGGVATIRGQIKDAAQRARVTQVVGQVPGVRSVENQLTIMGTAPAMAQNSPQREAAAAHSAAAPVQRAYGEQQSRSQVSQVSHEAAAPSNQAVAQQIASALTSAGLSGYDIEIRYKNGVASLIGAVDAREQAIMAHRATASVPGVNQVLNRLTVDGKMVAGAPAAGPQGYGPPGGGMPMGMPQGGMQMGGMPPQGAMPVSYQTPGGPAGGMPPGGMPPGAMPPPGGMPQYGQVQQVGHHIYNQPNMPNYAWPTYAPYDNSAAISYPTQYDASAFPYIGPYYPYPQVPMGWRKSTLEWDDGQWSLKFDSKTDRWWWFLNPHNWH